MQLHHLLRVVLAVSDEIIPILDFLDSTGIELTIAGVDGFAEGALLKVLRLGIV